MSGWLTPKLVSTEKLCGIPSSSTVLKTARWSVLGVKHNNPDSASPRYGQQRVEESLGCEMSGWLTPKVVSTEKLCGIPWPSEQHQHRCEAEGGFKTTTPTPHLHAMVSNA